MNDIISEGLLAFYALSEERRVSLLLFYGCCPLSRALCLKLSSAVLVLGE